MNFDNLTFENMIDVLPKDNDFTEMIKEDMTYNIFKDLLVLLYIYERAFDALGNKAGMSLIIRLKLFFFLNFKQIRENILC